MERANARSLTTFRGRGLQYKPTGYRRGKIGGQVISEETKTCSSFKIPHACDTAESRIQVSFGPAYTRHTVSSEKVDYGTALTGQQASRQLNCPVLYYQYYSVSVSTGSIR